MKLTVVDLAPDTVTAAIPADPTLTDARALRPGGILRRAQHDRGRRPLASRAAGRRH
jgi:hypothetical protein